LTFVGGFCRKLLSSFLILKDGWRVYMGYDTKWAGIALALLYMTVLGFDNITIGNKTCVAIG